jgi:hypothetical protein
MPEGNRELEIFEYSSDRFFQSRRNLIVAGTGNTDCANPGNVDLAIAIHGEASTEVDLT